MTGEISTFIPKPQMTPSTRINKAPASSLRFGGLPWKLIIGGFLGAAVLLMVAVWFFKGFGSTPLEFNGTIINVKAGGDLQEALDRAKPGDTITLEPGATFSGDFNLPNKAGSEFITIRSAAADDKLPSADSRIDPEKFASVLPKIESNVRGEPAISATDGAHHYRFVAVEFGPTPDGLYNIIRIGTGREQRVEELPHHIEFDRVWIHGDKKVGQRRGIAANGRNIRIINSYISDIKRVGEESQAIAAWATDGPIEIVNNYLEAAAENILFGGADSYLKLVPTDCVVRSNYLNKPLEWRDTDWVVKNLFEIKNGKRIKVENNLMTNNWAMGQDGTAILFTTRADNGDATVIEDIEFTSNIVRGAGNGVNIFGGEGSGGHRLTIKNNIFDDIDGRKWGSAGHFMKSSQWEGLTIENNTIIQTGNIANAYGEPVTDFIFRNNIVFENEYGIKGDNMGSGQEVIDRLFSGGSVAGNIILGGKSVIYKEENIFLKGLAQVGFVSPEKGNYMLRKESPYLDRGYQGGRIGADLNIKTVGHN